MHMSADWNCRYDECKAQAPWCQGVTVLWCDATTCHAPSRLTQKSLNLTVGVCRTPAANTGIVTDQSREEALSLDGDAATDGGRRSPIRHEAFEAQERLLEKAPADDRDGDAQREPDRGLRDR